MDTEAGKPDTVATIDANLSPSRREIMWQGVGGNDITLDGISYQFKTAVSSLSFTLFSLEYITRPARGYRTVHRCPGYRREEVTLRPVLSDCKVTMHATPSLHEKCLICGKVVEEGQFDCRCGRRTFTCLSLLMVVLLTISIQLMMEFLPPSDAPSAQSGDIAIATIN